MAAGKPLTSASTVPSRRLRTQPHTPAADHRWMLALIAALVLTGALKLARMHGKSLQAR